MIFLETSVLVAACQDNHVSHSESFALFRSLSPSSGFTSIHCVTELYSVMTRLPPGHRISPVEAWRLVEQIRDSLLVVSLTTDEALDAINLFMERGLSGGMLYDALVVAGARKMKAESIYTLNKKHFDLVAPDLVPRIVLP